MSAAQPSAPSPAARAAATATTGSAAHALAAALTGLATAYVAGAELVPTYALASLVFAISAFTGCDRLARHLAVRRRSLAGRAFFSLVMPVAFLILIALGTDAVQRGTTAWLPVIAALPAATLFACLALALDFALHDETPSERFIASQLQRSQLKLWFAACIFPGLIWLILQVGMDRLPQAAAAAVLCLFALLKAARTLHEYANDEDDESSDLLPVVQLAALAGPACGFIVAAALVFDPRWPLT